MANIKKSAPQLSEEVLEAMRGLPSVASRIKYLAAEGYPRADISRIMTEYEGRLVRYQWVRNVLNSIKS